MDKMLRAEIVGEVRRAMKESMELYSERWVDAEELCQQIGCISKGWIRLYGHSLPRERVVVTDSNGQPHQTSWCYPLHRIQRMMNEGQLTKLRA